MLFFQKILIHSQSIILIVCLSLILPATNSLSFNNRVLAQGLSTQVNQVIDLYRTGNYLEAISLWQQALTTNLNDQDRAIIYKNLAMAYRQTGQLTEALNALEQSAQFYEQQNNNLILGQILIEQGQIYNDLGQQKRAIPVLEKAVELAKSDTLLLSAASGVLGTSLSRLGNDEQALIHLQNSLNLAQQTQDKSYISTALDNLTIFYQNQAIKYANKLEYARIEGDTKEEKQYHDLFEKNEQLAIKTNDQNLTLARELGGFFEVKALLKTQELAIFRTNHPLKLSGFREDAQRARQILSSLPASREKAFLLIKVAQNVVIKEENLNESSEILKEAIAVSQKIKDRRTESFALGRLAKNYKEQNDLETALNLTRQAQIAAQEVNAAESLYLWQWQAGNLLQAKGDTQGATIAYSQAIATLQTIRSDLLAASKELQFDFRDSVEPIYREFIAILLKDNPSQQNIRKALDILDLLKLAELQNYFGDDCLQIAKETVKKDGQLVDRNAAILYSIILPKSTKIILEKANGELKLYQIDRSAIELKNEIDDLRNLLEKRITNEYLTPANKIYDLLIKPLEADLAAINVKNLVFVNDGVLRQIPMAALYDGKKFLIEKYALSTTPSLSLTAAQGLDRNNLQALMVGLTVEKPPFPALTNVKTEIEGIDKIIGGKIILDQDFTLKNLEKNLQQNSYPIVHFATHGKFGAETINTFLQAYDQRVNVSEIDRLIRSNLQQPVQLLTLSACQTAAGDNRSALGIAGVAVRAGVKSAVATLWYINDASTVPLVEEFYRQLQNPQNTKAEALRQAQLKLIQDENYNHPAVWAPFILIGNWL